MRADRSRANVRNRHETPTNAAFASVAACGARVAASSLVKLFRLLGLAAALSLVACAADTGDDDEETGDAASELSAGSAYKIDRKGRELDRPMTHNDTWVDLAPNIRAAAIAGKLHTHDRNGHALQWLLKPHPRTEPGDVKVQLNESVVLGNDRWFYVWGNGTGGGSGLIPGNWLSKEPRASDAEDYGNGRTKLGAETTFVLEPKPIPSDFRFCRSKLRESNDKNDESYDDYGAKSVYTYADGRAYQPLTWNLPDVPGGGIVRSAVEKGATFHIVKDVPSRRLYDETCKSSTKKRSGEDFFRVKITSEQKARWVEFVYGYVVPGATIPGGAANTRAYGWMVHAHSGPNGAPVFHRP